MDCRTKFAEVELRERTEADAEHDRLPVRVCDRAAVVLRCARGDGWLRMPARTGGEAKLLCTDPDPMPAACSRGASGKMLDTGPIFCARRSRSCNSTGTVAFVTYRGPGKGGGPNSTAAGNTLPGPAGQGLQALSRVHIHGERQFVPGEERPAGNGTKPSRPPFQGHSEGLCDARTTLVERLRAQRAGRYLH